MKIPQTYAAWRTCIEVHCGIPLTAQFIATRLRELNDDGFYSTEQLLRFYGQAHVARIRAWFQQAAKALDVAR